MFYLLGGTCLDGGEVVEGERAMGRHLHKPAIVSYWRARRARALVEMPLSLSCARVSSDLASSCLKNYSAKAAGKKKKKKKYSFNRLAYFSFFFLTS